MISDQNFKIILTFLQKKMSNITKKSSLHTLINLNYSGISGISGNADTFVKCNLRHCDLPFKNLEIRFKIIILRKILVENGRIRIF